MDSIIEKMMEQMLSKDYLYEPMKDIANKYPAYLKENADKLTAVEKQNYEKQMLCFQRLVAAFEQVPNDSKLIMNLMTEMQNYGNPPKELVTDFLPPGFDPSQMNNNSNANSNSNPFPNMPMPPGKTKAIVYIILQIPYIGLACVFPAFGICMVFMLTFLLLLCLYCGVLF